MHTSSSWFFLATEGGWHHATGAHWRKWLLICSSFLRLIAVEPTMNPVSGTMHERDHSPVPWYINPNPSSPCAQLLCTAERGNFPRAWWARNKSFIHATATSLSVCSFQLLLVTPALTSRNKQRWNQNKIFIRSAAVGSSARKTRVSRLRNCISGLCIKEKKKIWCKSTASNSKGNT